MPCLLLPPNCSIQHLCSRQVGTSAELRSSCSLLGSSGAVGLSFLDLTQALSAWRGRHLVRTSCRSIADTGSSSRPIVWTDRCWPHRTSTCRLWPSGLGTAVQSCCQEACTDPDSSLLGTNARHSSSVILKCHELWRLPGRVFGATRVEQSHFIWRSVSDGCRNSLGSLKTELSTPVEPSHFIELVAEHPLRVRDNV